MDTALSLCNHPGLYSYVMVPLFVEQASDESIEKALQRTGFDDVWDLLGAMREQDDVLVDIIRQMQEDKGRTGGYNDSRFGERVEVLGPSVALETIRASITAECLESLGVSWDQWFGLLRAYIAQEGHAHVKGSFKTANGSRLGLWVINQRQQKDKLPSDRKARLNALNGWVWDVYDEQWEEGFDILNEFSKQQGHTLVAGLYVSEAGFRLGRWVSTQRKVKFKMSLEQQARLESLPHWTWDVPSGLWEKGFKHLKIFAEKEGHSRAPSLFVTTDGYRLGIWAQKQRSDQDKLVAEQKGRLEALPGWSWDLMTFAWEEGFNHLKVFLARTGHNKVPAVYETKDGFRLGQWVSVQRKTKHKMAPERQGRLNSLTGWTWNAIAQSWETGFQHLIEYANQEGHTKVPQTYESDQKFPLGQWVSVQRRKKSKNVILAEQVERLEALPGWVWDRVAVKWDVGYHHLKEFAEQENHCKVPATFVTEDGYRLGTWVSNQRKNEDEMQPERIVQLEKLPGWIFSVRASSLDESKLDEQTTT